MRLRTKSVHLVLLCLCLSVFSSPVVGRRSKIVHFTKEEKLKRTGRVSSSLRKGEVKQTSDGSDGQMPKSEEHIVNGQKR